MEEVEPEAVNGGLKLGKAIQQAFLPTAVKALAPVGHQLLEIVQIGPVVPAGSVDLIGPTCSLQPLLQIAKHLIRNLDRKRHGCHLPLLLTAVRARPAASHWNAPHLLPSAGARRPPARDSDDTPAPPPPTPPPPP